jgi:hypothetical protein
MEESTFIQKLADEINAVLEDGLGAGPEETIDPREVVAAVIINLASVLPVAVHARGSSIEEERGFAVNFLDHLLTKLPHDSAAIGAAMEDPAIR